MQGNNDDMDENVKSRLKSAIKAAGGRIRISDLTGIPIATLNKQLSSMSKPSFDTIVRVSKALDLSIDWLVSDRREEDSPVEASISELSVSLQNTGINFRTLNSAVADVLGTLEANEGLYLTGSVPKDQLAAAIGNVYLKLNRVEAH